MTGDLECATSRHMAIVIGIRERRQHASRCLRRVRAGETITLIDRGEPLAEIRLVKRQGGALDRLIAAGRATPPTTDFADFLRKYSPSLEPESETLRAYLDSHGGPISSSIGRDRARAGHTGTRPDLEPQATRLLSSMSLIDLDRAF